MISGLQVTLSAPELRALCTERAEHHAERAATYARQVENLDAAEIEPMQYSGGDPKKALRDKGAEHANAERELRFIAAHLDDGERYLLGRDDLRRLGIVTDRF